MTYNVFSGTLNPTQSINQMLEDSCHTKGFISTCFSDVLVTMSHFDEYASSVNNNLWREQKFIVIRTNLLQETFSRN